MEVGNLLGKQVDHHRLGVRVGGLLQAFGAVHDDNFPGPLSLLLILHSPSLIVDYPLQGYDCLIHNSMVCYLE